MYQRIPLLSLIFSALVFFAIGCTNDNPVSTGFSSQGGYSLNLGAPSGTLAFGGRMVLTGVVRDQNGNPVNTSTQPVIFTSEAGGDFAPWQAQIVNGQVTTVYVAPQAYVPKTSIRAAGEAPAVPELPTTVSAPSNMPLVETITMSFQGASAKLHLTLYKP